MKQYVLMSSEYFSVQISVDDFISTDFLHIYSTFQSIQLHVLFTMI